MKRNIGPSKWRIRLFLIYVPFPTHLKVRIGDFGLAKQDLNLSVSVPATPETSGAFPVYATSGSHDSGHSRHTSGVGTQAYGAPEQLTGEAADEKVLLHGRYCR